MKKMADTPDLLDDSLSSSSVDTGTGTERSEYVPNQSQPFSYVQVPVQY
jgi:hypothetical protein